MKIQFPKEGRIQTGTGFSYRLTAKEQQAPARSAAPEPVLGAAERDFKFVILNGMLAMMKLPQAGDAENP